MKKTIGMKGMCCLLVLNFVCILLAGCGEGSGNEDNSTAGSTADTTDTHESGSSGDGQNGAAGNPSDDPDGRQVITAVVTWPRSDTLERISAYNESSPSYFVEIREYGAEGTVLEAEDLETQLTLDILSGKGPDLVIWDSGSYSPALASEKLMEDLYAHMDADQDFHREDYYENILQAFEMNGGLYVLPTSFSVETVCGKAEEMGTDRDLRWEADGEYRPGSSEGPAVQCDDEPVQGRVCDPVPYPR